MNGSGGMGYAGRRRFGGSGSPALVVAFVLGGLFLFSVVGPAFQFVPLVPLLLLLWLAFGVVRPMIRASAGRTPELTGGRELGPVGEEHKEKELLRALARYGELSPVKAALETTLTVSEADRMLSGLAKDGYVKVHASEGQLEYVLYERDRREPTDES